MSEYYSPASTSIQSKVACVWSYELHSTTSSTKFEHWSRWSSPQLVRTGLYSLSKVQLLRDWWTGSERPAHVEADKAQFNQLSLDNPAQMSLRPYLSLRDAQMREHFWPEVPNKLDRPLNAQSHACACGPRPWLQCSILSTQLCKNG